MASCVRQCAECSEHIDAPGVCTAQQTTRGIEITLLGKDGQRVTLCNQCTEGCARSYDELGKTQWEKALGTAANCAVCTLSRHPSVEDLNDFRRASLASLRVDKESYSRSSRLGFDHQQKALGRASAKTGKTRGNLRAVAEKLKKDIES